MLFPMKFTFYPHKKQKTNKQKQKNKNERKEKGKEKPLMDLCLHLSSESLVTYVTHRRTYYFAYSCLLIVNLDFMLKYYKRS